MKLILNNEYIVREKSNYVKFNPEKIRIKEATEKTYLIEWCDTGVTRRYWKDFFDGYDIVEILTPETNGK